MTTAGAIICPVAVVVWLPSGQPTVPASSIALGTVSGILEAGYFTFLAAAYRRGDLSLVYPLARGTAPLLAVAARASSAAAGFALLTGVTIAAYSAVDSTGVKGTTAIIYAGLIWLSGVTFLWVYVWLYQRSGGTV